jgi:UDP-N-acetylglucosamine 2-epimerase (non-hydrolysing)
MENKKIAIIGGARPNFMKIAPLCHELKKQNKDFFVINTGQHFTPEMADDFFAEFKIKADYSFTPERDTAVTQLVSIMKGLEDVFMEEKPDLVIVVGDVNSTLAGALVANKMQIKLAHVEAGLRSNNKEMPEEHNRVLTDRISDFLFVTSEDGVVNLKKEGITDNVHFVGNIMMDTLEMFLPSIEETQEEFYFCTLHRAENVDNKKVFEDILDALEDISKNQKIYLPLHPRTKKMAEMYGLLDRIEGIFEILPLLNYKESIYYQKNAKLVLTDSGGIQEETSYLGVPCITLRRETERPVTVEYGTNVIGGVTKAGIIDAYKKISYKKINTSIPLWDGKTAKRIISLCAE